MKYSRLFRSALLLSVFVLMVGGFGSPVFAKKILLLSDTNSVGVNALLDDFIANGDEVTVVFSPDSNWTGANPSPEGFHSIVHLNGITWYSALSYPAQTALVEFVNNGGGYVGTQWIGYELCCGSYYYGFNLSIMNDLVLHDYSYFTIGQVVYSVAPGQESHPILSGVPASFTFESDGGSETQRYFAENPSTVLMTAHDGTYEAVLVREVGQGRVASFGFAPDYNYYGYNSAMQNPNIRKLILNAAIWTGGDGAEVIEVTISIKPGTDSSSINVNSAGVTPIAIFGAEDFDITTVDPASIRLEDVVPLRNALEDVDDDGFLDLTLKFDTQELVQAIKNALGREVEDDEEIIMYLTGNLMEEFASTPIEGEDVVVILKKGKGKK